MVVDSAPTAVTSVADVRALFGSAKTPADLLEHRRGDVLSVLRGFAAACDAGDKTFARTSPPDVRPALELLEHLSNDDARRDDDVALVVLTHLKILSRTHAVAFGERARATLAPGMESLVRFMIGIDRRMTENQDDGKLRALAAEAAGVALNACSHPANAAVFAAKNSGGVDALLSWLAVAPSAPRASAKNAAGALQIVLHDTHGRKELNRVHDGLEKTLRALRAWVKESEKTENADETSADAIVARLTGALHNFTSDADYALNVRAACGDVERAMFAKLVLCADPETAQSAAGIARNVARARRARLGLKPSERRNAVSEEDVTFAFAVDGYGEGASQPGGVLYKVPSVQAMMSDADIDAAVRFCDGVLSAPTLILLPPTVEIARKSTSFWTFWKHRTVTYPVARIETASSPALFVKIEMPKKGAWDASIVTASGACVARWWKEDAQDPLPFRAVVAETPAPLEWGGTHFGEVGHEDTTHHRCGKHPEFELIGRKGAIFAKGPTCDVVFAENEYSKRNDLMVRSCKICCYTCCLFGLPCALSACLQAGGEPYEALFKTSGGTEIGSYKVEKFQNWCGPSFERGRLPDTEGVVHFGSMTAEQRRLALVTIMHGAAIAAEPPEGGGGGGGGGGM